MVNTPCLHRKLRRLLLRCPQMILNSPKLPTPITSSPFFLHEKNSQHQVNNQPGQTAESQANSFSSRSLPWNQSLRSTTLDTSSTCTATVVVLLVPLPCPLDRQ